MYTLVATDWVWFVMVGLSIGLMFFLVFESHGVTIFANLAFGTVASLIGGITAALLGLGTPLLASFLFTLIALVMFNVWNLHGMEKTVDDQVRIVRKYDPESDQKSNAG